METTCKKINNNNDITEVNNKDTKEIINDNKPLIIIENTNNNPEPLAKELKETNNTKTPEVEATAGDTVENQPERQLSYAEWITVLFKKFSKDMEYINENTTDHELSLIHI